MSTAGIGRGLGVGPTYNENANLGPVVTRLRAPVQEADGLVVDDGSPDGTGQLADRLAAADDQVHVLHRRDKAGLGAAYIAGFHWATSEGFDVAVEMDADGSHAPEELPRLLAALRDADLVIGSRYVAGGEVRNWPRSRQLLSRGGKGYGQGLVPVSGRAAASGLPACRRARRVATVSRCWRRSAPTL